MSYFKKSHAHKPMKGKGSYRRMAGNWFDESQMLQYRRWWVEAHPPTCPTCGGTDITLVDYTTEPVNCQCNDCRILFLYEVPDSE